MLLKITKIWVNGEFGNNLKYKYSYHFDTNSTSTVRKYRITILTIADILNLRIINKLGRECCHAL